MTTALLIIGDELKSGEVRDANGPYLARLLGKMGMAVDKLVIVGDHDVEPALSELVEHFSVVITTGGLGPTHDDITLEKISAVLGISLPKDGTPIENSVGTAPGMVVKTKGCMIVSFPGVPSEMRAMSERVLPEVYQDRPAKEFRRSLNFCLLNETKLSPLLSDMEKRSGDIRIGIYPGRTTLRVSLQGKAESQDAFVAESNRLAEEIEGAFPTHLFPASDRTIEEAVHHAFIERGETLALGESCTGGTIASKLTKIPDASKYFIGSAVVYSNELKEKVLGVRKDTLEKHGAVSKEVVEEMLEGLFKMTSATWAIAVSGIAGPDGGTEEKPVGTVWAGIASRKGGMDVGLIPFSRVYPRDVIIERSANYLLGSLWRKLAYGVDPFHDQ